MQSQPATQDSPKQQHSDDQMKNVTPTNEVQTCQQTAPDSSEVIKTATTNSAVSACASGEVTLPASGKGKGNSPLSLSELATLQAEAELAGPKSNERRAWAECPLEQSTPTNFCDDPTPLEASMVATTGTGQKHHTSSDSGGEDSSKENKECISTAGEKTKNPKKKGELSTK